MKTWLSAKVAVTADEEWKSFYSYLAGQIDKIQEDPQAYKQENLLPVPPGAPIGDYDYGFCWN
jgi:hypothetical protein